MLDQVQYDVLYKSSFADLIGESMPDGEMDSPIKSRVTRGEAGCWLDKAQSMSGEEGRPALGMNSDRRWGEYCPTASEAKR
jgi:hypothetical protein